MTPTSTLPSGECSVTGESNPVSVPNVCNVQNNTNMQCFSEKISFLFGRPFEPLPIVSQICTPSLDTEWESPQRKVIITTHIYNNIRVPA